MRDESYRRLINYSRLARLHRPLPILLLVLPVLILLTSEFYVNLFNPGAFTPGRFWFLSIAAVLGGILARSGGCIVNDVLDHKFDKKVKRTEERPLAAIYEYAKPTRFGITLILVALAVSSLGLALSLSTESFLAALLTGMAICIYPLFKRFFLLPQLGLGLIYNAGVLIISLSLPGGLRIAQYVLYFSVVLWTFAYDTVYAAQDKEDDEDLGLQSSVLTLKGHWPRFVRATYNLTFALMGLFGVLARLGWGFFAATGIAYVMTVLKIRGIPKWQDEELQDFFEWNVIPMALVLLGVSVDILAALYA